MRPDGGAPAPSSEARRVARLLELDRAAAEVCHALPHAILLKGPTFAQWLYASSPRDRVYSDVDVLAVPDAEHHRVLEGLGFERAGEHPLGVHTTWVRQSDNVTVELHSTLLGIGVDPAAAWDVLSSETEPLGLAGSEVLQLNEPARALHACLHAVSEGHAPHQTEDLRRACLRSSPGVWQQVADLARRLDALDACARALHSIPEGRDVAAAAGLATNKSVSVELRARGASNAAQALGLIDDARGARAKLAVLKGFARGGPLGGSDESTGGPRIQRVLRAIPEWWKARRSVRKAL